MGQLLAYAGDFRSSAEAISSKALTAARLSNSQDLSSAGLSLCVRTPFDAVRNYRILKFFFLTQFILVLVLIFGGVALGVFGFNKVPRFGRELAVVGAIAAVAGGSLASFAVDVENWIVRRRLGMLQSPIPNFTPTEAPVLVRVEDPQTCNKLKVVVEDSGMLYCDAARQLIVIEGIFDRYVVHGRDVRECYIQSTRVAGYCVLTFQLVRSRELLTLALNYTSKQIIRDRQRSNSQVPPPLAGMLERTLGIVVAPAPTTA